MEAGFCKSGRLRMTEEELEFLIRCLRRGLLIEQLTRHPRTVQSQVRIRPPVDRRQTPQPYSNEEIEAVRNRQRLTHLQYELQRAGKLKPDTDPLIVADHAE
jgi:hypothetical protein